MEPIRVVVSGALGRMGREVVGTILREPDLVLAGALEEPGRAASRRGAYRPDGENGVPLAGEPEDLLEEVEAGVLVDFSRAAAARRTIPAALNRGMGVIIGTTGLSSRELDEIDARCLSNGVGAIEAANFSLGTLLMMHLAGAAAPYFDQAEIIESHLDTKPDAPSATSLAIAARMLESRGGKPFSPPVTSSPILPGTRGGESGGIPIHSLRSAGAVYSRHQILFGGPGQSLSLKDETVSPSAYMPGVMRAIRTVGKVRGLARNWTPWVFDPA